MKNFLKVFFFLLLFFFFLLLSANSTKKPDAKEILKKMDELYRSSSSRGLMEMEITTPHWQRTLRCKIWSQGMEKTFIRILEPKKERGMATLRIKNEIRRFF